MVERALARIVFPRNGSLLRAVLDDVLVRAMGQPSLNFDPRPGAQANNAWWKGDTIDCGAFWWGFESLWLPDSLLETDAQVRLADALFANRGFSCPTGVQQGLAGAPPDAIAGQRSLR